MYSSRCRCYVTAKTPNGSKAVTLLLRLSTLALSLTSAVFMASASECTINGHGGAKVTITFKNYPPFVYQVVLSITAAVLEAAAIYLQVAGGKGGDDDHDEEEARKLPRIILIVLDGVVPALVNTAAGVVISAVIAYGPEINACTAAASGRFCEQVSRSKLLSIAASVAASSTAIAKDVPLPFSLWPVSSE